MDRRDLDYLRRLEPIAHFSEVGFQKIVSLALFKECLPKEEAFSPADLKSHWIYLKKGEFKLELAEGGTQVFIGGSEETQLAFNNRFLSLIRMSAITKAEVLLIEASAMDALMAWEQRLFWNVPENKQAHPHPYLEHLALSALSPEEIEVFFQKASRMTVKAGDLIVREGDMGDAYYLIEEGLCKVFREIDNTPTLLAELVSGQAFGEESLLHEESSRRNATILMKTDGVLFRLSREDFIALLRDRFLQEVSAQDIREKTKDAQEIIWLDARYRSEYTQFHLPGAKSVPLDELRKVMGLLDPKPMYLVYCQTGRRSAAAVFLMNQYGYHAICLKNGLAEFFQGAK